MNYHLDLFFRVSLYTRIKAHSLKLYNVTLSYDLLNECIYSSLSVYLYKILVREHKYFRKSLFYLEKEQKEEWENFKKNVYLLKGNI